MMRPPIVQMRALFVDEVEVVDFLHIGTSGKRGISRQGCMQPSGAGLLGPDADEKIFEHCSRTYRPERVANKRVAISGAALNSWPVYLMQ